VPDGKDILLQKYGSGGEDCTQYLVSASASLGVAGTSAAVGIASAPTGLGALAGLVGTVGGLVKGATDLAQYFNCDDTNEQLREVASECNAQGGVLLRGAGDSDVVCLQPGK
jgi:hypothetical protein